MLWVFASDIFIILLFFEIANLYHGGYRISTYVSSEHLIVLAITDSFTRSQQEQVAQL